MKKVGLDLIDSCGKYIVVAIDYFTRMIWTGVIERKSGKEIVGVMKRWMSGGSIPSSVISDNGREFCNSEFSRMCIDYGILHRKVGVESHKSNGRVERVIGSLKEGLRKSNERIFEEKVRQVTLGYNETYHCGIGCTPVEAWNDESGAMIENSSSGRYSSRFKRRFREKFSVGQEVRMGHRENVKEPGGKGRFTEIGRVQEKCGGDSYLVRKCDNRIVKKRHYDLKGLVVSV
jgi:hypothetical protein